MLSSAPLVIHFEMHAQTMAKISRPPAIATEWAIASRYALAYTHHAQGTSLFSADAALLYTINVAPRALLEFDIAGIDWPLIFSIRSTSFLPPPARYFRLLLKSFEHSGCRRDGLRRKRLSYRDQHFQSHAQPRIGFGHWPGQYASPNTTTYDFIFHDSAQISDILPRAY